MKEATKIDLEAGRTECKAASRFLWGNWNNRWTCNHKHTLKQVERDRVYVHARLEKVVSLIPLEHGRGRGSSGIHLFTNKKGGLN